MICKPIWRCLSIAMTVVFAVSLVLADTPPSTDAAKAWTVGTPIATYWAGPAMSDAVATQMKDGGFNVVWCGEKDLDLVQKHGLRGMIQDPLLTPGTLDTPDQREKLDAFIDRVKSHPATYMYFITDEPAAGLFPGLGKLVAHLRERDPAHIAYINLFPTYATNDQLGTKGDVTTAYREYLKQYIDVVKPGLISWDNYQFYVGNDGQQYFLNLAMVRRAAQDAKLPFLNIVQAASWQPQVRVPTADEMRYLVYTTAAYGAQGISYYVYQAAGHEGGLATAEGKPTPLYDAVRTLNPEFVAIASELAPLTSTAVYHTKMKEAGCGPLPADAPFKIESTSLKDDTRGMLLGYFAGKDGKPRHVMVVNLNYKSDATVTLRGPQKLQTFDPVKKSWSETKDAVVELKLPRGGGVLVRVGA